MSTESIEEPVDPVTEFKAPTQHTLSGPPPTRAFALAAVVTVIGALFVVLSRAQGWPAAVLVLAVVVTILGVALFGAGAYAMTRMRVRGELDGKGYTFHGPHGSLGGDWLEITKVTASETGHRITFVGKESETQDVIFPVGSEAPDMESLVEDITTRLIESRKK